MKSPREKNSCNFHLAVFLTFFMYTPHGQFPSLFSVHDAPSTYVIFTIFPSNLHCCLKIHTDWHLHQPKAPFYVPQQVTISSLF